MLENENLDNQEIENQEIENPIQEDNSITLDALESGEVKFYELTKEQKAQFAQEAYDKLPDDEAREAWDNGWKPKAFFGGKNKDGTEKEFVDYKEFLQNIKNKPAIQNERFSKALKEKNQAEEELKILKTNIAKLIKHQKEQSDIDLKIKEQVVNKKIQEAKELGDIDAYEQAAQERMEIEAAKLKNANLVAEELPEEPKPVQISNAQQQFLKRNEWFQKDKVMTNYAIVRDQELAKENPHLSQVELLELLEEDVKETFPEKFVKRTLTLTNKTSGFKPKVEKKGVETLSSADRAYMKEAIALGIFKDEADFIKYAGI